VPIGDVLSAELEAVVTDAVDAIYTVHSRLGPGLLESTYEICLYHELLNRGRRARRQVDLPVVYGGVRIDAGYRLDLLVEDVLVIEVKSVEKHNPLFEAQLLTYLKLSALRVGLLANFNVPLIKSGIKRIIH